MSQRDLRWIKWVREGASNKKRSPAQDNPRFKFSQPKFGTLLVRKFVLIFSALLKNDIISFDFSWSISFSYFVFHGYPFTNFMEYPLLLIQQVILISMHLELNRIASMPMIMALNVMYLTILYYMTFGPAWVLQILIVSNIKMSFFLNARFGHYRIIP